MNYYIYDSQILDSQRDGQLDTQRDGYLDS